jgi:hypothetical protein
MIYRVWRQSQLLETQIRPGLVGSLWAVIHGRSGFSPFGAAILLLAPRGPHEPSLMEQSVVAMLDSASEGTLPLGALASSCLLLAPVPTRRETAPDSAPYTGNTPHFVPGPPSNHSRDARRARQDKLPFAFLADALAPTCPHPPNTRNTRFGILPDAATLPRSASSRPLS